MALIASSQRLEPERAPRLRRLASLIESQADRALLPDRARRLARDMRIRASELECGAELPDETARYQEEIQAIGFACS